MKLTTHTEASISVQVTRWFNYQRKRAKQGPADVPAPQTAGATDQTVQVEADSQSWPSTDDEMDIKPGPPQSGPAAAATEAMQRVPVPQDGNAEPLASTADSPERAGTSGMQSEPGGTGAPLQAPDMEPALKAKAPSIAELTPERIHLLQNSLRAEANHIKEKVQALEPVVPIPTVMRLEPLQTLDKQEVGIGASACLDWCKSCSLNTSSLIGYTDLNQPKSTSTHPCGRSDRSCPLWCTAPALSCRDWRTGG